MMGLDHQRHHSQEAGEAGHENAVVSFELLLEITDRVDRAEEEQRAGKREQEGAQIVEDEPRQGCAGPGRANL
jgi:hypothetical protein